MRLLLNLEQLFDTRRTEPEGILLWENRLR